MVVVIRSNVGIILISKKSSKELLQLMFLDSDSAK